MLVFVLVSWQNHGRGCVRRDEQHRHERVHDDTVAKVIPRCSKKTQVGGKLQPLLYRQRRSQRDAMHETNGLSTDGDDDGDDQSYDLSLYRMVFHRPFNVVCRWSGGGVLRSVCIGVDTANETGHPSDDGKTQPE